MVVYCQSYEIEPGRVVHSTACERCGAIIGNLDYSEVVALSTGKYGPVLCFECEEKSCPSCQKELTGPDKYTMDNYGVCWYCKEQGMIPDGRNMPDATYDTGVI